MLRVRAGLARNAEKEEAEDGGGKAEIQNGESRIQSVEEEAKHGGGRSGTATPHPTLSPIEAERAEQGGGRWSLGDYGNWKAR